MKGWPPNTNVADGTEIWRVTVQLRAIFVLVSHRRKQTPGVCGTLQRFAQEFVESLLLGGSP